MPFEGLHASPFEGPQFDGRLPEPLIMVSLWTARAYTNQNALEGPYAFPFEGPQFDGIVVESR